MISVIVPTFNVEGYIHVCLNSVLNQTYTDFEIICIDDCSDDNTLKILSYFSKKDYRVKILKNEHNRGPGYSRNRGLNEASGDYIFFLDSDDWISPNTFEVVHNIAECKNVDLVIFKLIVFYNNLKYFGFEKLYDINILNEYKDNNFNHYNLPSDKLFKIADMPCNKLYRKTFLDEYNIKFTDENLIYEDSEFFFNVITKANSISFLNEYLYIRRRRDNSIMTLTNKRLFDVFPIFKNILELFYNDKLLWDYYKRELVIYLFKVLNSKYDLIEKKFKSHFFKSVQYFFSRCYLEYGLYDVIMKNVDESILLKFKQL